MHEDQLLRSTISEYEGLLVPMAGRTTREQRCEHLVCELRRDHDWTDGGARTVVSLANDYGAFMLRNALALAVALGKEDGDLGF